MRRSLLLWSGLALAVLAAMAFLVRPWTSDVRVSAASQPVDDRITRRGLEPRGEPKPNKVDEPGDRRLTSRDTVAGVADTGPRLLIEVIDPSGSTLEGTVYWRSALSPPLTSSLMAPDAGHPLPRDGSVREMAHAGSAAMDVPAGCWTWLRVTGEWEGPLLSKYARVAPFMGVQRLRLELSDEFRRIHVFVVKEDLASACAHEEVSLYKIDSRQPGTPRLVGRQRTDEHGYACFERITPDGYLLCAPAASPEDRFPFVARIMLPPKMPPNEMPLTLVSPGRRATLRLRVTAPDDGGGPPQARLFLRRKTALAPYLIPVPALVAGGTSETECRVPAGEYEIGVVPQGAVGFLEGTDKVVVKSGGSDHEVRLGRGTRSTQVTLEKLLPGALPVVVSFRPSEGILEPHSELVFCGPYNWRVLTEAVWLGSAPGRLVAGGRSGTWISSGDVPLGESAAKVDMVRAAQLHVRWRTREPARQAVMTLKCGAFERRVRLSPDLVSDRGEQVIVLAGREVVPAGTLEVDCRPVTEGPAPWTTRCEVDKNNVVITVDENQGNRVDIVQR